MSSQSLASDKYIYEISPNFGVKIGDLVRVNSPQGKKTGRIVALCNEKFVLLPRFLISLGSIDNPLFIEAYLSQIQLI